jgi:cytosine permease
MNQTNPFEDFSVQQIPDAATISGAKIAIVLLGLGITLPIFQIGAQVSQGLGLADAAIAFFIGCLFSGFLGIPTSIIGSRARLSTYMILAFSFGRHGAKIVNLALAVMLLGWFSTVGDLLGAATRDALLSIYGLSIPQSVYTAIGLMLMTMTGIFGFRVMERFALITVPSLIAFMLYVLVLAVHRGDASTALHGIGSGAMSFKEGTSTVVGSVVLTAVLAPDMTRYAANARQAIISNGSLAIGYPLIMLVAAVPAAFLKQPDLMTMMIGLGVPGIAIFVLVASTWTSNTGNLYCSTLTLATIFPRTATWRIGLMGAGVALVAALFGVSRHFVPFLVAIGISATPIGAIYVATFYVLRRQNYDAEAFGSLPRFNPRAFVAWAAGSAVGYASNSGGGLITPLAAVDSLIVSFVVYVLLYSSAVRSAWRRIGSA